MVTSNFDNHDNLYGHSPELDNERWTKDVAGQLDGTVILITGASSGIGAATARLLAEQGGLPVLSARRADRLDALAQELPGALAIQADVRDPEQVRRLVEKALEHNGRVDALVNNAGQGPAPPARAGLLGRSRGHYRVELLRSTRRHAGGYTNHAQPWYRRDRQRKLGDIPDGASRCWGLRCYQIGTQHAVAGGPRGARPYGIVVSVVYPSITATEFHDRLRAGNIPAGRPELNPHSPEYAAKAIVRALHTGEAELVIPRGPERPEEMELAEPQA